MESIKILFTKPLIENINYNLNGIILSFLSIEELNQCRRVSKTWQVVIQGYGPLWGRWFCRLKGRVEDFERLNPCRGKESWKTTNRVGFKGSEWYDCWTCLEYTKHQLLRLRCSCLHYYLTRGKVENPSFRGFVLERYHAVWECPDGEERYLRGYQDEFHLPVKYWGAAIKKWREKNKNLN